MNYKILSIFIPLIIGALGSIATSSSVNTWYTTIVKPSFNPPSWIFGPVWTVLYIMMGISLYLIWTQTDEKILFIAFGTQLTLNLLWSIFFFGMQNPFLALLDIILLLAAIIWTIALFFPVSKTAAYLLVPYLLWVSFATILNASIWWLNR